MLQKKDLIKQEYNFNNRQISSATMHLGYSIDNRFARCTGTSIYSFVKNNPQTSFSITIISSDLSEENIRRFQELAKSCKININICLINTAAIEKMNFTTTVKWPLAIYFRFLFPIILKDVKRILYVDGDIICHHNCRELFTLDIDNYALAACIDPSRFTPAACQRLNIPENSYFNSGMMVINLEAWQKTDILQEVIKLMQKYDLTNDQDILNKLFSGRILYLPNKYNYPLWLYPPKINKEDAVLLHFGGHPKPWQKTWPLNKKYTPLIADIYGDYEKFTPWGNIPLDLPKDYKDCRLYAILLLKQHQYPGAVKYFAIYAYQKLMYKIKN